MIIEIQPGIPATLPISIRDGNQNDYAFILSSWSNDVHHIKYDNFIPNSIFFPRQKVLIDNILKQSLIKIAHVEDEKDLICGYLILQPKFQIKTLLLHWAHVKSIYRCQGIFTSLLNNYLQDEDPHLVVTSPFYLLPQFKRKYGIIFDPSHIDNLRF